MSYAPDYLNNLANELLRATGRGEKFTTLQGEILEGALGIEPAKWTKGDQMRVGAWLKSRDWEKYRRRSDKAREWRYRKPAAND